MSGGMWSGACAPQSVISAVSHLQRINGALSESHPSALIFSELQWLLSTFVRWRWWRLQCHYFLCSVGEIIFSGLVWCSHYLFWIHYCKRMNPARGLISSSLSSWCKSAAWCRSSVLKKPLCELLSPFSTAAVNYCDKAWAYEMCTMTQMMWWTDEGMQQFFHMKHSCAAVWGLFYRVLSSLNETDQRQ